MESTPNGHHGLHVHKHAVMAFKHGCAHVPIQNQCMADVTVPTKEILNTLDPAKTYHVQVSNIQILKVAFL